MENHISDQQRKLTLKDLVFSGLCIMAPLAPFTAYYQIADASFGMVGLVYIIGLIAMLLVAYSYSRLSKEFPVAGSAYAYVQRSLNPHVGFLAGWINLCVYLFIPGFIYVAAAQWLTELLPAIPYMAWLFIFAFINLAVNIKGVDVTAKLNTIIFWAQIILIGIFIALSAKAVFVDGMGTQGFSLQPIFNVEHFDFSFIATAISLAVFGFVGFDTIGALADEAKNPKKNIGRAALICIAMAGSLFFVQAYMAGLVAPDYSQLNPATALFDVAKMVGGQWLFTALILVNAIAYGITIPININSAVGRIVHSMSKDNVLPFSGFFVKVHPTLKTPVNALIVVNLLSLVFSTTLTFDSLMGAVNFNAMLMYALLNVAVISHFFFQKKQRDFKGIISYLIVPLIGLSISVGVLSSFDKMSTIVAVSLLAVGIVIGLVKSNGYKRTIVIEDI